MDRTRRLPRVRRRSAWCVAPTGPACRHYLVVIRLLIIRYKNVQAGNKYSNLELNFEGLLPRPYQIANSLPSAISSIPTLMKIY